MKINRKKIIFKQGDRIGEKKKRKKRKKNCYRKKLYIILEDKLT